MVDSDIVFVHDVDPAIFTCGERVALRFSFA